MRGRTGFWRDLGLALLAAATTWVTMLSWRGFAERPGVYLEPLAVLAALVAVTGAVARRLRLPPVLVVGSQVALGLAATVGLLVGSPFPLDRARIDLRTQFEAAFHSIQTYAAPVGSGSPGIHPPLILLGLACLVLVDLLAVTWRRPPVAGLVLLAIYTAPVSLLGDHLPWWVFVLGGAGFLGLLLLTEEERLARWGRAMRPGADDDRQVPRSRLRAVAVTAAALGLGLVLPLALPSATGISLFANGVGPGNGKVSIDNPMTDLRRDLRRGADIPLVEVTTDDPAPTYLRTSVLTWFTDNEWRAGDREIPAEQTAQGQMPPGPGLQGDEPGERHTYELRLADGFTTRWLPVFPEVLEIHAADGWRYDDRTRDFLSSEDDLTGAGSEYRMLSKRISHDAVDLARASSGVGSVDDVFSDLPDDLPPMVEELADEVTRELPTKFARAVALQEWFRRDGGFTYDLSEAPVGNGTDELVAFLTEGSGRVGYCEQFASAMAVMARTLDIPSRVAVGFLRGEEIAPGTWQFSTHDLHAWVELYFPGSGWVQFEPTPATRASQVPPWTRVDLPDPTQSPTTRSPSARPSTSAVVPSDLAPEASAAPDADTADTGAGGVPWAQLVLGLVALVLAALVALWPLLVRRSRREHRWRTSRGPETAWAELRDTVVDLGERWPAGLSPHATGLWLGARLGDRAADRLERPFRGRGQDPEAARALDRIVLAVERHRFARPGPREEQDLRPDVDLVTASLTAGAPTAAVRRAAWWPRSVFVRGSSSRPRTEDVEVPQQGALVDHVGDPSGR